jgi:hypothetical protein
MLGVCEMDEKMAAIVEIARELIDGKGLRMHFVVNKATPWFKPSDPKYVAETVYQDYYDIPAELIDALERVLDVA